MAYGIVVMSTQCYDPLMLFVLVITSTYKVFDRVACWATPGLAEFPSSDPMKNSLIFISDQPGIYHLLLALDGGPQTAPRFWSIRSGSKYLVSGHQRIISFDIMYSLRGSRVKLKGALTRTPQLTPRTLQYKMPTEGGSCSAERIEKSTPLH